jgi:hypothetical protein
VPIRHREVRAARWALSQASATQAAPTLVLKEQPVAKHRCKFGRTQSGRCRKKKRCARRAVRRRGHGGAVLAAIVGIAAGAGGLYAYDRAVRA